MYSCTALLSCESSTQYRKEADNGNNSYVSHFQIINWGYAVLTPVNTWINVSFCPQASRVKLVSTVFIRLTAPGRLLNIWALRVGAYSRWALIRDWALIKFSPFSASEVCLFCNKTINAHNKTRRSNEARFL